MNGTGPSNKSAMERREFCHLIGCAALVACAGSLTGCARALEWSENQHAQPADVAGGGSTEPSGSVQPTGSVEPTGSASETATPTPISPDVVVRIGQDPAARLASAVAALGGWERFVKAGARVVVKPNVLTGRAPEYAVTTDPDLLEAIIRSSYDAGAREVIVLDRPTSSARAAFEVSGLLAATERAGGSVKFLTDRNFKKVTIPNARVLTEWPMVRDIFEADTLINVPIAKTHGMAVLTMSMKNLMGILGSSRGQIHQSFASKICDVATVVKPDLVVLDARRILTAHGPSGGSLADVAELNTLVVGTNMASVDAYGTTLFGKQPTDLEYLVQAAERGIGEIRLERLLIDKVEM